MIGRVSPGIMGAFTCKEITHTPSPSHTHTHTYFKIMFLLLFHMMEINFNDQQTQKNVYHNQPFLFFFKSQFINGNGTNSVQKTN